MNSEPKILQFIGSARKDLRDFPEAARRVAGVQLRRLQLGEPPVDWKPMPDVGAGACEIRVRTSEGGAVQHRVIYVAKFDEAVYVLHAFDKKTRRTPPHHLEVASARYRQMLRDRREPGR